MKYSSTTLKELTARYRAVLRKCAIFNACLFLSFAVSGSAGATPVISVGATENISTGGLKINEVEAAEDGAIISVAQGGSLEVLASNEFQDNKTTAGSLIKNEGTTKLDGTYTFIGNKAADSLIHNAGNLEIDVALVKDTVAGGNGGVIHNAANATLKVNEGSVFMGNATTADSAGVIYNAGEATIDGALFTGNTSGVQGGAIRNEGKMDIDGSVFSNNESRDFGGAISASTANSDLTIKNSLFTGNISKIGGAICDGRSDYSVDIKSSTFRENIATGNGGAMGVYKVVNIENSNFIDNQSALDVLDDQGNVVHAAVAGNGGGALYLGGEAQLTLKDVGFSGNKTGKSGGAISSYSNSQNDGFVSIDGANFVNNSAAQNGGAFIQANKAPVSIKDATFTGNTAGVSGGAFYKGLDYNVSTNSTYYGLSDVTFSGDTVFTSNEAGANGGAVYNSTDFGKASGKWATSTPKQTVFQGHTIFTGNTAGVNGGAVFNGRDDSLTQETSGGRMVFEQEAEFVNNTATTGVGGAIASIGSESTLTMKGATNAFTNNTAGQSGGAVYAEGTTLIGATGGQNTFTNNTSGDKGGAIASVGAESTLTILGAENVFAENSSVGQGGAVYGDGNLTIGTDESTNTFTSNTSNGAGGAIASNGSNGNLIVAGDVEFKGNRGAHAGAIFSRGTATIGGDGKTVTFKDNSTPGYGGAIMNYSDLTIGGTDATVTFDNNSSGGYAGAIYGSGNVTIAGDSSFTNNTSGQAGAILINGKVGTIGGHGDVVKFENNKATTGQGGAIFATGASKLTIGSDSDTVTFKNNVSAGVGGAIASFGDLTITGRADNVALFEKNMSTEGSYGAISSGDSSGSGSLTLTNAKFDSNASKGDGGAVGVFAAANIENVEFVKNTAGVAVTDGSGNEIIAANPLLNGGGAILVGSHGQLTMTKAVFSENESNANGGAITSRASKKNNGSITINEALFNKNVAAINGGAIFHNYSAKISVNEGTFTENKAGVSGGAIYNGGYYNYTANGFYFGTGAYEFSGETTFTGNKAGEKGGAVYNGSNTSTAKNFKNNVGYMTFSGATTFENNEAKAGGAVYNGTDTIVYLDKNGVEKTSETFGGTMTFTDNVTFTSNNATSGVGGAVANVGADSVLKMTGANNKFTYNTSTGHGSAIYNKDGKVTVGTAGATNLFDHNVSSGGKGAIANIGENSSLTIVGSTNTFTYNESNKDGGVIYNEGTLALGQAGAVNKFENNTSPASGGAIRNNGTATIQGDLIVTGTTSRVGAVYNAGTMTITDGDKIEFTGNVGKKNGSAGLQNGPGGTLKIGTAENAYDTLLFQDNVSEKNSGSALYVNANLTEIYADNVTFTENTSTHPTHNEGSYGGAAFLAGGTTKIVANTMSFTKNEAGATGEDILSDPTHEDYYRSNQYGGGAVQVRGRNNGTTVAMGSAGANILFEENTSAMNGGAFLARSMFTKADGTTETATTTITGNTTFNKNTAGTNGGALANIAVNGGKTTLTIDGKATFTENTATAGNGGAIYNKVIDGIKENAQLTITGDTSFSGNKAFETAGAVYNDGILKMTGANNSFVGNQVTMTGTSNAGSEAGAIYNAGDMVVGNGNGYNAFTGNTSHRDAGAIQNTGTMTLAGTDNNFFGNSATQYGGAIHNTGTMNITGNTSFDRNSSGVSGAIDNKGVGATLTISGGSLSVTNTTSGQGGAISSDGTGAKLLVGATFDENGAVVVDQNVNNQDITFQNNTSSSAGGGAMTVSAGGLAGLYGDDIVFDNNTSDHPTPNKGAYGGAVFTASDMDIIGNTVTFTNNKANQEGEDLQTAGDEHRSYQFGGGAIQVRGYTDDVNVVIGTENGLNTFDNNTSAMNGGAIHSRSMDSGEKATTVINGTTVLSNNKAALNGGAISNVVVNYASATEAPSSKITLNGTAEFRNNTATAGKGGAIYNDIINDQDVAVLMENASVTVTGKSTFANNTALEGGAIYNNGALSINGGAVKLFSQNTATAGNGGAIYNNVGDLEFSGESVFMENKATGLGGAIYMNGGNLSFNGDNVFMANTSSGDGAAIYNNGGNLTMAGSANVFSTNISQGSGAAIYNNGGLASVIGGQFMVNQALGTEGKGGAIYSTGKEGLNIENGIFKANVATVSGGAVIEDATADAINTQATVITGTIFDDNHSGKSAGALALLRDVSADEEAIQITDTSFTNNTSGILYKTTITANADAEGGAVVLGENTKVAMNDVEFISNKASGQGGAIASKTVAGAEVDVGNAVFIRNEAGAAGGAISDYAEGADTWTFENIAFEQNKAGTVGGAIYVKDGNVGFTGENTFVANTATGNGGAFYNESANVLFDGEGTYVGNVAGGDNGGAFYNGANGSLTFKGTHTFTSNVAGTARNDIHNDGQLNISGTMIVRGGITGNGTLTLADNPTVFGAGAASTMALRNSTGNLLSIGTARVEQGVANFESGSVLEASLMNAVSYGALTAGSINATGAELRVTTIASEGTYAVINGVGFDTFQNVTVEESLFDYEKIYNAEKNSLVLKMTAKNAEDINKKYGTNEKVSNILSSLAQLTDEGSAEGNVVAQQIMAAVGELRGSELDKEIEKISPTTAPITTGVATAVTRHIANAVAGQLEDVRMVGRSGGEDEVEADVDMWVKGLASHADQNASRTTEGFEGTTKGVALGVDMKKGDAVFGFGYANTTSDVKSGSRRIDVDGHNLFAYAEYQPAEWYVRGLLNYGMASYDEEKSVLGVRVDADYDVTSLSGEFTTGREYANGLAPFGGLRFLHLAQDGYTDAAGLRVNSDDVDVWTAVAGAKYSRDIEKGDKVFRPEIHAALTYDLLSDTTDANVTVGDYTYVVGTRRLPRFGVEAGVGLGIKVCDHIDFSFTYDANLRKDYTVHSGNVKIQYNF